MSFFYFQLFLRLCYFFCLKVVESSINVLLFHLEEQEEEGNDEYYNYVVDRC